MRFGFVGCGNMGGAILSGALSTGALDREHVAVFDIRPEIRRRWKDEGVRILGDDEQVAEWADAVVLAVKPQDAAEALRQCVAGLDGKVLVSIIAGYSVDRLSRSVTGVPRILRVLPNTPALVREGAFAVSSDSDLRPDELEAVAGVLRALGIVELVPERLIDAVCGLSGGAPAYVAMFIEALADGGVLEGLPRQVAYRLAAQTCIGAGRLLLERGLHPGALKDMVTSPGGTTIEGCAVLERSGLRGAVIDAVRAGAEKSRHL